MSERGPTGRDPEPPDGQGRAAAVRWLAIGLIALFAAVMALKVLDVFAHAVRWKRYWSSLLAGLVSADVLEVGAGVGATTSQLASERIRSWTCLEPDAGLAGRLRETLDRALPGDERYRVEVGTLDALSPTSRFDAILYIDVLEHIVDDRLETRRAAGHLRAGGRLVVLAPAHQFLFSPFDRAIGHHRRYSRKTSPRAHRTAASWNG